MRIVAISDTHTMHRLIGTLPEGDVLLHAGDFMNGGHDPRELIEFADWWAAQPHEHKIVVAGNHDRLFETAPDFARSVLPRGTRYLQNTGITINGIRFWGSPYQPSFCNWAFNVDRGPAIKRHWDFIPNDTDVLITHGPPMGFLDKLHPDSQEHVGCEELRKAVQRVKPQFHIFGHIHGGAGRRETKDTTYINASFLNEAYKVAHAPHVFDVIGPKVRS